MHWRILAFVGLRWATGGAWAQGTDSAAADPVAVAQIEAARGWSARTVRVGDAVVFPFGRAQPTVTCAPLRACVIELESLVKYRSALRLPLVAVTLVGADPHRACSFEDTCAPSTGRRADPDTASTIRRRSTRCAQAHAQRGLQCASPPGRQPPGHRRLPRCLSDLSRFAQDPSSDVV
jgi:hypothetical protein